MTLENSNTPSHIAIIMDGNARWAKSRNLPTAMGHKAGLGAIKNLVKSAVKLNIKYLTIYAFSTENWGRPKDEVGNLMFLLKEYLAKEVDELVQNGVRILISGNLQNVEKDLAVKIKLLEEKTKDNKGIVLNVAFDYGARQEIVDCLKQIVRNKIPLEEINEDLISKNLYQPELPDPDLLIRTGGDKRISNFLLWQIAYTELYFTEKFWPDFSEVDLKEAILDFNQRKRNYGTR